MIAGHSRSAGTGAIEPGDWLCWLLSLLDSCRPPLTVDMGDESMLAYWESAAAAFQKIVGETNRLQTLLSAYGVHRQSTSCLRRKAHVVGILRLVDLSPSCLGRPSLL